MTFTNAVVTGQLKICKVSSEPTLQGVTFNFTYSYSVNGVITNGTAALTPGSCSGLSGDIPVVDAERQPDPDQRRGAAAVVDGGQQHRGGQRHPERLEHPVRDGDGERQPGRHRGHVHQCPEPVRSGHGVCEAPPTRRPRRTTFRVHGERRRAVLGARRFVRAAHGGARGNGHRSGSRLHRLPRGRSHRRTDR